MDDITLILAFLKRHLACLRKAGSSRKTTRNLFAWLGWHFAKVNVCCVKNGEKITAVGVARPIKEVVDARLPYKTDERGTILFVEQVAATNNDAFKELLRFVKARWPQCSHILFNRSKNGSYNRLYPMNEFMRKAKV